MKFIHRDVGYSYDHDCDGTTDESILRWHPAYMGEIARIEGCLAVRAKPRKLHGFFT